MATTRTHPGWLARAARYALFILLVVLLPRLWTSSPDERFLARPEQTEQAEEDLQRLASAKTDLERFYALGEAASAALFLGRLNEARELAVETLGTAEKYRDNWNYGNAIHVGHVVLGRLALGKDKLDEARAHLLKAGRTPGSPQLDTFGPGMLLARELILRGEREVVLEYLELCRLFWDMDRGCLDEWTEVIRDGDMPEFGATLAR